MSSIALRHLAASARTDDGFRDCENPRLGKEHGKCQLVVENERSEFPLLAQQGAQCSNPAGG